MKTRRQIQDVKDEMLKIVQDLNVEIESDIYDWSKEGPNARQAWFEAQISTLFDLIDKL